MKTAPTTMTTATMKEMHRSQLSFPPFDPPPRESKD
jgi:hypothetical protein